MTSYKIICVMTVLATLISKGFCINCYYCNSANNSACLDVEQYDEEIRSRIVPIVDCDASSAVKMDFFCRKIVQTIFHSHREAEVRVTRGCGWVRHPHKDCYRADNRDHLETACQCFTDYCNSADSADPNTAVALFILLSAVLFFYR